MLRSFRWLRCRRCAGRAQTPKDRAEWLTLTGKQEATTRVLCDLARQLLAGQALDELMSDDAPRSKR